MTSKKTEILDTALVLFVENGYENTPTAEISRAAGIATGTLFHHFKNKIEILNQLYIDCKISLKKHLIKSLSAASSERKKLYIMWQNFAQWALDNPLKFKYLESYSEHPLIMKESREKVDNTYAELIQLVKHGKESGIIADLPTEYLMMLTQLHFAAAAKYCIAHPKTLQKKKLPKRLFQAYWQAISE